MLWRWVAKHKINALFSISRLSYCQQGICITGNDQLVDAWLTANLGSAGLDSPESLKLSLKYSDFRIAGTVNAHNGEEVADINDLMAIAIYEGENKIGDLEIEADPNTEESKLWLVLVDESKADFEQLLQPVLDELEEIIVALEEE